MIMPRFPQISQLFFHPILNCPSLMSLNSIFFLQWENAWMNKQGYGETEKKIIFRFSLISDGILRELELT